MGELRASAALYLAVVGAVGVSTGFLLPYYLVVHGYASSVGGLLLAIIAVISAAATVFLCLVVAEDRLFMETPSLKELAEVKSMHESLRVYRARQRALLEDLDEIVELLREIRDVLKSAGEA
ncbi:MAG: hypothetical protein DRJ43_04945 [Thermoprotei archaeon]|nr:MAG: hypothetical protein DRJ43_04945 [Thermoprotei archaeon]